MKVSVSGWPGGGSSTLSIILCKMLNLKHVRGGETFRLIYKRLKFSEFGSEHLRAHSLVEPYFGPIYDRFIDYLLISEKYNSILVESDIASFRVGKIPGLFSIFLKTDLKTRKSRMKVDSRPEDGNELEQIDRNHQKTYKELHKIDWFDNKKIEQTHQYVLENSNISIELELKMIFKKMVEQNFITQDYCKRLLKQVKKEEEIFWNKGKSYYNEYLLDNDLVLSSEEILKIINIRFKKVIDTFPSKLKKVIRI